MQNVFLNIQLVSMLIFQQKKSPNYHMLTLISEHLLISSQCHYMHLYHSAEFDLVLGSYPPHCYTQYLLCLKCYSMLGSLLTSRATELLSSVAYLSSLGCCMLMALVHLLIYCLRSCLLEVLCDFDCCLLRVLFIIVCLSLCLNMVHHSLNLDYLLVQRVIEYQNSHQPRWWQWEQLCWDLQYFEVILDQVWGQT